MEKQPSSAFQPIAALRSPYSLNWRTHLFFAAIAMISGFINDFSRLGGSATSWLLVVFAGIAATVISIELLMAAKVQLGLRNSIPLSIGILAFAGFVRGAANFLLGGALGIIPASDWAFRLFGGPIYVVTTYIIFNTLIVSFIQQRDSERALKEELGTLQHSRSLFALEIERLRVERAAKVRELIAPSIWEITKRLDDAKLRGKTDAVVSALREANEKVVRPLSQTLLGEAEIPTISALPALGRIGRLTLPKRTVLGEAVSVTFLVLVSLTMGYSTQVLNAGFLQALMNVLAAGAYFGAVTYVLKYATKRIEHSTFVGLLASAVIGLLVGYSSLFLVQLPELEFSAEFPLQAALFFGIAYPSSYLIAVTTRQSQKALQKLQEVVSEQKILNSQLRQQVWLDQKLLATELHGSVQATLHAAALSLANNPNPKNADLDATLRSVTSVVDRLGDAAYLEGSSFDQVLKDIAEVWEGSCVINYDLGHGLPKVLAGDARCARSVIEVVRETITNAIKHNHAKHIDVKITLEHGLVSIKMWNVGHLPEDPAIGVGSEIMRELTHTAELTQEAELVVLRATIPLSLAT